MLGDLDMLSEDEPAIDLPEIPADPCSDSSMLECEPLEEPVNRRFEYEYRDISSEF